MQRKTAKNMRAANERPAQPGNGNGGTSHGQADLINAGEIAARAYEIYEREGRSEGQAMDHWLRAESELRSERGSGANPRGDISLSPRLQQEQHETGGPASASAN